MIMLTLEIRAEWRQNKDSQNEKKQHESRRRVAVARFVKQTDEIAGNQPHQKNIHQKNENIEQNSAIVN